MVCSPDGKEIRSSVPLAEATKKKKSQTRLEENIYLWPCSFGAVCIEISLQSQLYVLSD
jgi:hypothetical protein